jgi:hypothetical protein
MSITLPYIEKLYLKKDVFVDMKIFPGKSEPKFSLTLVKDDKRVICFDNHEGQEPHVHIRNKIYKYRFINIYRLIDDFYAEVEKFLGEEK